LQHELTGFAGFYQITVCNERFASLLAMIYGPECGDLGYDLGYLRHGSFGPGYARCPGRLHRVALDATNGLARVW
jgi:hypothetical protein